MLSNQSEESNEEPSDVVVDTTVDDIVAEGEAAHRSGDHDSALSVLTKQSHWILLMLWLGSIGVFCSKQEQDPKGAKQAFVICLDLDPNHGPGSCQPSCSSRQTK